MWWPGDEGGWATANILLGKTSPAGRLPVTWGKRLQDYAATDPAIPSAASARRRSKTTYSEGVNVGYRWFDQQNIEPLFAFGHGLSYTTFAYSRLEGGGRCGRRTRCDGEDQEHGRDGWQTKCRRCIWARRASVPAGVQFPVRTLAGIRPRAHRRGSDKTVTLHVAERQLQYWSDEGRQDMPTTSCENWRHIN